jgi:dipeptidyl aminopeptidase/acylaminoacyl peptidase
MRPRVALLFESRSPASRSVLALLLASVSLATAACGRESRRFTGPLADPDTILVSAPPPLWLGDTTRVDAIARRDGFPVPSVALRWSTSHAAVVEVDSLSGTIRAKAVGIAVIAVRAGSRVTTIQLEVNEQVLVYEGLWTGLSEAFTLRLDGSVPQRLLAPYTVTSDPALSSRGQLVYAIADYVDFRGDVYVATLDGDPARKLTPSAEMDDQPAWSPDGSRIAFRSYQELRQGQIWVMNADGSDARNLTPDLLPGSYDSARPAWSPDGTRIAFASTIGGNWDIWTMRQDGSDMKRITSTTDLDTEPSWSPDGQRIVFRRSSTTGSDLFVVSADGGAPARLPHPQIERAPAWSPDGRLIVFALYHEQGGDPQLYTMRPDGSEPTLRTSNYGWGGGANPSWYVRRGSAAAAAQ